MFLGVRLCSQNLNLSILQTVHASYRSITQNMHGQTACVLQLFSAGTVFHALTTDKEDNVLHLTHAFSQ